MHGSLTHGLRDNSASAYRAFKRLLLPVVESYRKQRKNAREARWLKSVISDERRKILQVRGKPQIRVAFIVIHQSTWKTSRLFDIMESDPLFTPFIIVAPDIKRSEEFFRDEFERCQKFFSERNYPVHVGSRIDHENDQLLSQLQPDIAILNNPHGITCRSLHNDLIERYLACYIPYHVEVGRYHNDQDQYNASFHNGVWKIFAPHETSLKTYERVSQRQGKNVSVTGYPGNEHLVGSESHHPDPWKPLGLKRIIWAPHHTIDMPTLPYANFLRYADHFRQLVEEYADRVQWCFKPHPLLKPKLVKHPDWGSERTEAYYSFWENHANTQLELGGYAGLFRNSDAMIHDSGSFLAEYLYVDKPVMYLWSSPHVVNYFNDFGLEALFACERGDSEADTHGFVDRLLQGSDQGLKNRRAFLEDHPAWIAGTSPSERILQELKNAILQ